MNLHLSEAKGELSMSSALPPAVAALLQAVNEGDLEQMIEQFTDGAIVNDQFEEFQGKRAIEGWSERDVVGMKMNITVSDVRRRPAGVILTTEVTGSFEGYGLPEPLILLFYFSLHNDLIDQLIILRKGL